MTTPYDTADFDGYFDTDQDTDTFEISTAQEYASPTFFRGLNAIIDRRTGKPTREIARGFCYEAAKLPPKLISIMEGLVEAGEASLLSIEHKGQGQRRVEDYYQLRDEHYVVLAHGYHAHKAAAADETRQVGIATGTRITYKDGQPKYTKESFTKVLVVHPGLVRAGFVDEYGLPIPLLFSVSGRSGGEFSAALQDHARFIQWLRKGSDPKAQLFSYLCPLRSSEDTKAHENAQGDSKDVYYPVSHEGQYDNGRVEELRVAPDLLRLVRRLLFNVVDGRLVPGGPAVEWCREQFALNRDHVEKFDPKNELRWGRNKDVTPAFSTRMAALLYMGNGTAPTAAPPAPERVDFGSTDEALEAVLERLESYSSFFRARGDDLADEVETWLSASREGAYTLGEIEDYIKTTLSPKKLKLLKDTKPAFR